MSARELQGKVTSTKMKNTVTVEVGHVHVHRKYLKRMMMTKKLKAHYPGGDIAEGDTVTIVECRPRSRDKRWEVKEIVRKASTGVESESIPSEKEDSSE